MKVVKHPSFPSVVKVVPDSDVPNWAAAGWVPAEDLAVVEVKSWQNDEVIEAVIEDACPTCGAVGDELCVTSTGNETTRHASRA